MPKVTTTKYKLEDRVIEYNCEPVTKTEIAKEKSTSFFSSGVSLHKTLIKQTKIAIPPKRAISKLNTSKYKPGTGSPHRFNLNQYPKLGDSTDKVATDNIATKQKPPK